MGGESVSPLLWKAKGPDSRDGGRTGSLGAEENPYAVQPERV